jgi:hypothetical protein
MATVPKWQEPLAERASRADQTLRAVLLAPGGGEGALLAAAAADRDLAELCREFAERTTSPLLKQLLINGGRALSTEAGFLTELAQDDDGDTVAALVAEMPLPAERVDEDQDDELDEDQADAIEDDEDQALVEPMPAPVETSGDAPVNATETSEAQASTVPQLLAERAGQAVHERVCDCKNRGFGYTLRTHDLDAIGPAAAAAVLRALRVLVDINHTPGRREELSLWLSDVATELEPGETTMHAPVPEQLDDDRFERWQNSCAVVAYEVEQVRVNACYSLTRRDTSPTHARSAARDAINAVDRSVSELQMLRGELTSSLATGAASGGAS